MTARTIAKQALRSLAPDVALSVEAARARAHSQKVAHGWGLPALGRQIAHHYGPRVLSGPFRGMTLAEPAFREHVAPYLLGTYESEVHPWLNRLLTGHYTVALDVGCSVGYYAVGLARLLDCHVLAFDTDWWARRAVRETARANGVAGGVTILGACRPDWLRRHLPDHSLIVSDCEGYEATLFANRIPALDHATLIIECHGETESVLRERFSDTHRIETIRSVQGTKPSPVPLTFLSPEDAIRATVETRGPQTWLVCDPMV